MAKKIIEYSVKECLICQEMVSELAKLKAEGFKISVIDCKKDATKCKLIKCIPTLIIQKDGRSKKIEGFISASEVREEVKKL